MGLEVVSLCHRQHWYKVMDTLILLTSKIFLADHFLIQSVDLFEKVIDLAALFIALCPLHDFVL